jgi:hypothetical protein
MSADLRPFLINTDEIREAYAVRNLVQLPDLIRAKLAGAKPLLRASHIIERAAYTDVFATSDIHTDLKKLNHLLKGAGIVSAAAPLEVDNIMTQIYDGGSVEWVPQNTLLIIVGDLVDGQRGDEYSIDKHGHIELLLHMYLFNLRIKARAKGSEIRFTAGNHDYHTVIKAPGTLNFPPPAFYNTYVHQSAQRYFVSREGRRNCLLPFYNCCPYLFINLENEAVFIHGGLHVRHVSGIISNSSGVVTAMQAAIDTAGEFSGLGSVEDTVLSCPDIQGAYCVTKQEIDSPLWTRWYANRDPGSVCPAIATGPFKMVVVGHCPTGPEFGRGAIHLEAIKSQPAYGMCREGGCVLVGCESATGPSLAFVDIGMSACFRRWPAYVGNLTPQQEWVGEVTHRAEFLHFRHDASLSVANRYYNQIIREKVDSEGAHESIVVWAAAAAVPVPVVAASVSAAPTIGGYRKNRGSRGSRGSRRGSRRRRGKTHRR